MDDKTAYLSINARNVYLCMCLCLSVSLSRTTHSADFKFRMCLADGPSECSAKFCVFWTNNTKDIIKRGTGAFFTPSAVATPLSHTPGALGLQKARQLYSVANHLLLFDSKELLCTSVIYTLFKVCRSDLATT